MSDEHSAGIFLSIARVLSYPLIFLLRCYQWVISPWLGPKCRFTPSCSEYSIQAFRRHGLFRGLRLTIVRLSKCHPWGGSGYDPVP